MILAMNKASLIYIFLALNLDLFILFFVLGVSLFRGLPGLSLAKRNISKKTFFVIFTFSFWIMISQIAVLIEYQLDTFIVGFFLPIGAVAAYVVIVYPFRMIQQISGLAASAIMPAVAEMQAKSDGATLEGFVYYVSRWHNALVASMALATFIFCAPFLHIWMDGQFDQYIWIAQLACIFQLLWQANAMVGQVYIGAGHSKKLGLIAACTACLNLVFSLTLVQLVGLEGVILGTVLAGFLGELLFFSFCLTDVGVSRARYLLTSICKGQLPALVCFVCVLPFFQTIQKMDSWLSLVVSFGLIVSLMISTSFLVISSKRERLQVVQFFKNLRS
jgi:O-antigen/teichoic acid export membrane protein